MTTTKKPRPKPQNNMGKLKATLFVGSVFATLLGADLVATHDLTSNQPAPETIVIQSEDPNRTIVIDNSPIPEIVVPDPIVRSRSSK